MSAAAYTCIGPVIPNDVILLMLPSGIGSRGGPLIDVIPTIPMPTRVSSYSYSSESIGMTSVSPGCKLSREVDVTLVSSASTSKDVA